jgi:hypothetical protein
LHQGAAESGAGRRVEQRQLGDHRSQRLVPVAVHQEIVTHRQQHEDVGFERPGAEERRESVLFGSGAFW